MKKLCILVRNYLNPIPEGRTNATIDLVNSMLLAGIHPDIFSLGYPFFELKGLHRKFLWPLAPNLIGISDGLGMKYPSRLLPLIDFRTAILLSPYIAHEVIYMVNVDVTIYSTILGTLRRLRRKKFKTVAHIFHPFVSLTSLFHRQRVQLLKRKIARILCINKYLQARFSEIMGKEKVFHVPYPTDTSRFKPRSAYEARKALNLPLDACIVGFIGHLNPERGVFDLLKAFAKLQTCNDTLLAVAPSPFTDTKSFQAFLHAVERMDLRERVKLLCNVAGVKLFYANMESGTIRTESFYNAVDVMVLPFRNAHYPLDPPAVLVEALSSGTPLVTTPVGAIKEVVNEERGLLVEPGNTDMLKDALEYLLNDEKARKEMGSNARDYTVKNLSLEVIGQKIKKIFEDILSK